MKLIRLILAIFLSANIFGFDKNEFDTLINEQNYLGAIGYCDKELQSIDVDDNYKKQISIYRDFAASLYFQFKLKLGMESYNTGDFDTAKISLEKALKRGKYSAREEVILKRYLGLTCIKLDTEMQTRDIEAEKLLQDYNDSEVIDAYNKYFASLLTRCATHKAAGYIYYYNFICALELYYKRNYKDAINTFNAISQCDSFVDEDRKDLQLKLGLCYYETKRYSEATPYLLHAINDCKLDDDRYKNELKFRLALCYFEDKRYPIAKWYLRLTDRQKLNQEDQKRHSAILQKCESVLTR